MKMILFTRKGARYFHLSGWRRVVFPALAILMGGGLFAAAGYLTAVIVGPGEYIESFAAELVAQRREVDEARDAVQADINALTSRLGMMQAQVARLEAMGGRLVKVAGLDNGEFTFDAPPGMGGPEGNTVVLNARSTDLLADLDRLSQVLADREEQLRVLEHLISARQTELSVMPGGWPVSRGYISSGYGMRSDPFTGHREFHAGLDFVVPEGSDVLAMGGGVVVWAGDHQAYGKMVEIDHGNGYVTRYAHNSKLLVTAGDIVRKGQVIAASGNTGRSTGPHVHLEVIQNGRHVNPAQFVQASSR